jgi:hypothetical protein
MLPEPHALAVTESAAMSSTPSADPAPTVLAFNGQPIRFVRIHDLPYFAAEDLCLALGLPLAETLETQVAEAHKRLRLLPIANGHETNAVLSPIGAWTLTLYLKRSVDFAFQRWVFKETKVLQPDAFDRERYGAAQCMALRPDGDVPPRPHPRSGRAYERDDLKLLPEHREYNARKFSVVGALRVMQEAN